MAAGTDPSDVSEFDSRRWLRDLGALIALPALWLDHEPGEIATSLLSVLFGTLQLHGAYARFGEGAASLEVWRPSTGPLPPEFRAAIDAPVDDAAAPGLTAGPAMGAGGVALRVAAVPVALPWENGIVLASAPRDDFPTAMETHLLRVAVSQAAIAIHTGRRLSRERAARAAAEEELRIQRALLATLLAEVGPPLERLAQRIREAERWQQSAAGAALSSTSSTSSTSSAPSASAASRASAAAPPSTEATSGRPGPGRPPLTRREVEVLGLLAQGLSNREIAGVLWLSDRTVERHITGLYRKIGVARRSEATAFALRHGIG